MKKALGINLLVDPKHVRRAVAMIEGEALTDEQLDERFFNQDNRVDVDLPEDTEFQMALAMVSFVIAKEIEAVDKEQIKGKFARKMEQMKNQAKNN